MAILLATLSVCISCGDKKNKSVADFVDEMYNEGLKTLQDASSMDLVQSAYDNTSTEVAVFLAKTKKKIEREDSVRIDNAGKSFLEACCKKAREYDNYLNTEKGLYYIDDEGKLRCGDDEPQGYHLDNPAMYFKAYKPIFEVQQVDDETHYQFKGVIIEDADGVVKYSDEDAEQYYNYYAYHFFFAYMIAYNHSSMGKEIAPYLQKNLFNVVCHMPLDESYPSDVREIVNRVYYDYKDKATNMRPYKRGYGYVEYAFEMVRGMYGEQNVRCFKIYRDNDSGRLMLDTSIHGYNPPNAY